MFNLIIVDDEDIILNGLSKYINWTALNFELVGTAHSMSEALELVESHPVDVVLTDIRMEYETGLDLIAKLAKEYPDIKTIILSGYEEFEYARRALQYGAFDFLTKPVNFDTLYETFRKLNDTLLTELNNRQGYEEYLQLKKATFLNNLARQAILPDAMSLQQLDIPLTATTLLCARFRIEALASKKLHAAKLTLEKMLTKHLPLPIKYLSFSNTLNEVTLLLYDLPEREIILLLEHCTQGLEFVVTIGLSKSFTHLETFHKAYFQAGKALDYKIIKTNSLIIPFVEIENILYVDNIMSTEFREKIVNYLSLKDISTLTQVVVDEIKYIGRHSDTLNLVYSFCIELYLTLLQYLKTHHAGAVQDDIHDLIKQLILRDNIDEITRYTVLYINSQKQYIAEISPCSGDSIKTAQNYIQEHYAENLTLNTLADFLFIHPIYLSKLFKEKTGQNFIDYLTHVRMEKSKHLLAETNLKIYDISEMVGYESPKYFSKLFKDIVGTTPKLYRSEHAFTP